MAAAWLVSLTSGGGWLLSGGALALHQQACPGIVLMTMAELRKREGGREEGIERGTEERTEGQRDAKDRGQGEAVGLGMNVM